MVKEVELPGGSIGVFRNGMPDDEIPGVLRKEYSPTKSAELEHDTSTDSRLPPWMTGWVPKAVAQRARDLAGDATWLMDMSDLATRALGSGVRGAVRVLIGSATGNAALNDRRDD